MSKIIEPELFLERLAKMKVSIVIPAFNEEKLIARSLQAVREASDAFVARGWEWEVVVCDNNSTDRTREIAAGACARVVFEPINQISRSRNKGGFAATGDWLVFIDADSFPSRRLFERTAEEISKPDCAGGGCLVRLDEARALANMFVGLWSTLSRMMRWAAGSYIFCQAEIFRELGGFSEKLFVSEEIEFSQRLKKAAREKRRRVVIITDERLVTSARKMHLYKPREHARFMLKAFLFPRRVLVDRTECAPWYDGRR